MSPLANTGMDTALLMQAMVPYSAAPSNLSARVLPCTERAATPNCSASLAMRMPLRCCLFQPVLIFRVTGTSTAATTATQVEDQIKALTDADKRWFKEELIKLGYEIG